MTVKRMLCASSIAAGVGLAGLLGAATAYADPAPQPPQIPSNVKLNHHERKLLRQGEQVLPQLQGQLPAGAAH